MRGGEGIHFFVTPLVRVYRTTKYDRTHNQTIQHVFGEGRRERQKLGQSHVLQVAQGNVSVHGFLRQHQVHIGQVDFAQ